MRIVVRTRLAADAGTAWDLVSRSATLRHVARGVLGFRGALPDRWEAGQEVTVRLLAFNLVPVNEHALALKRVDGDAHVLVTEERGGILRTWDHRISITPDPPTGCRYTDEVDVDAGLLTPVAWAIGHLFFRYRQARLRGLARVLA
jgi:hypothetical protein